MASASTSASADGARLRWALPAGLLLVEYLAISLLVDLPVEGPALALAGPLRIAIPVILAAVAAGWLVARGAPPAPGAPGPPPAWRPLPALALQPVAFAATALSAWRLLGPGAPPPGAGALAGVLGLALLAALLAAASAAPLGWWVRRAAGRWLVPLLALGVGALAWRITAAAEALWGRLSAATLGAVAALLRLGPGEVTVDLAERAVGLDGFEVIVAPVCSGVDGAGLVVLFLATWIALGRRRLRVARALWLLPVGALAALAANALRIAALLAVGASGREALALGAFHSKLGWILFLALALGGVALAERWPWLRRPDAPAAPALGVPAQAGPFLGPLVAALAAALLAGAWQEGPLDPWYALRPAAAVAALALARRALPAPRMAWRAAWLAARLLGAVAVVPLVEELAFRGFLLPWLVSPDLDRVGPRAWTPAAVAASSLAFGLLHAEWLAGALAGAAFAAARLWRGRLADAVVAHAASNAVVAGAVLLAGRWDLW